MKQYLVERIDNGREMPTHWDVIRRDDKGEEVVIASCGTQQGAAQMAADLNGEEMERKARIDAAYDAGYRRPIAAGRVTRQASGLLAAARAAGIDVRPMGNAPLSLGTKPNR